MSPPGRTMVNGIPACLSCCSDANLLSMRDQRMLLSSTRTGWNLHARIPQTATPQQAATSWEVSQGANPEADSERAMYAVYMRLAQECVRCTQHCGSTAAAWTGAHSHLRCSWAVCCCPSHLLAGSVSIDETSTRCFTPPDALAASIMLTTPCQPGRRADMWCDSACMLLAQHATACSHAKMWRLLDMPPADAAGTPPW